MLRGTMSSGVINADEAKKAEVDDMYEKLSTDSGGLSSSEAKDRIQQYGSNEITEKKVNPVLKFLSYLWGPIPFMIEAAVILSAILRRWEDFYIIFALLLINAIVGFWQENKADKAIEMLKKRLAPNSRVRLGDIVPADIKLVEGDFLSVDESALTGESLPVEKKLSGVAYSGSIVRQGEMNGLVFATGVNTYFGKTAELVEEAVTRSHFQKAVLKIGDYLIVFAVSLMAIVFLLAVYRHQSLGDALQFSLVLIVAAIPAALPAVLSVTMAVGAIALAGKEAIVSKLVSLEEMAGMDVLCSDKTGTITKNELTVGSLMPFGEFKEEDVILYGALASREEDKDTIDLAIIDKAKALKAADNAAGQYKRTGYKPFDPVAKRTEATLEGSKGSFKVSKGAAQVIADLIKNKEEISEKVDKGVDALAAKGYRALAVAKTDDKNNWHLIGLIGLYDPPREDSAETIKAAESMGIDVKMVTGDHIAIAKEIAGLVSLGKNIILPSSFLNKSDREAKSAVEEANGFAEVYPEHKFHIVEILQKENHIVGMTGDGVNDAPALKKADAGIAVSGATDAAKSAADIVLTKPGLSVIIDAVKESRKIFQRMQNYSIYRIAETIRVLIFITLSIIIFQFYPITALMIVLLAVLNDIPIMSIAYDNVKISDKPEKWNMRMILALATMLGVTGVFFTFGMLTLGLLYFHLSHMLIQSLIYLKLSLAANMTVFMARTRGPFWSIRPANILLMACVFVQVSALAITTTGVFFSPLPLHLAGFVWGYVLMELIITDFLKVHFYKMIDVTGIKFHI
jgi:H+-transporting ATPase